MRKITAIGLVVLAALSLMIAGPILAQDGGTTSTAWLGIKFDETDEGVVVTKVVSDSPAAIGGLLVDDVIVSLDEQTIESGDALTEIILAHEPGDSVSVVVNRDGSELTLEIELGSAPTRQRGEPDTDLDPLHNAERILHVELEVVENGYQVQESRLRPESTLAVDDVITAVNGTPIAEVDWQTLSTSTDDQQDAQVLTLTVLRDAEEITVEIEQSGGSHGHGMGGPGQDRDGGRGGPGGGSSQDGTVAPHKVEPGATCDQCHTTEEDAVPTVPETTSPDASST
ncbi:MAG: PDZ domain-containing protein [Chloroflexi bacterium]|nr:PDZ domain-containing protein [Chloroflexota bacterium]